LNVGIDTTNNDSGSKRNGRIAPDRLHATDRQRLRRPGEHKCAARNLLGSFEADENSLSSYRRRAQPTEVATDSQGGVIVGGRDISLHNAVVQAGGAIRRACQSDSLATVPAEYGRMERRDPLRIERAVRPAQREAIVDLDRLGHVEMAADDGKRVVGDQA